MHRQVLWILLGTLSILPGCSMSRIAFSNTVSGPLHFERYSDEFWRKVRDKKLAEEAWERAQSIAPQPYSRHYARGFKVGFMDYLFGGEGNMPLVPPERYWSIFYQTPEGNEAIQDWFAGWRHGNAAAKESGYRQLVTVPTSLEGGMDRLDRLSLQSDRTDPKTGEPLQAPVEVAPPPQPMVPPAVTPGEAVPTKPAEAEAPLRPAGDQRPEPLPPRPSDAPRRPTESPPPPPRPGGSGDEYQSLVEPR